MKDIDNKEVYKDFLSSTKELYKGNELMMHCLSTVAVKYSVESSVESLISRYETHFDRKRQLTEENAHQEMVIAEVGSQKKIRDYFGNPLFKNKILFFILQNGPVLVHATPLLTRALDKYFLNETKSSEWHFFPTYETGFYLPDTSKTIKRLQKEQSRLSFMDK